MASESSASPIKKYGLPIAGVAVVGLFLSLGGDDDTATPPAASDETLDPGFNNIFELEPTKPVTLSDDNRVEYSSGLLPDATSDPRVPRLQGTIGSHLLPDGSAGLYVNVIDNEPEVRLTDASVTFGDGAAIHLTPVATNEQAGIYQEMLYLDPIQPCAEVTANEELNVVVVAHRNDGTTVRFEGLIDSQTSSRGVKACSPNFEAMDFGR